MSISNNKYILRYVSCADEHIRPGMRLEERRRLLRGIPLRELLVCVYLARKAENNDDEVSLDELQESLLEDHIIEESDTTVQIAGYDPTGEVASSFYMRLFETWQNYLSGFSESEKRDFFAVAAVLPFYCYHYFDAWELSDEWTAFFDSYLDNLKKTGTSEKMDFQARKAETDRLLKKWWVYRKRCNLDMIESPDIKDAIQFGYEQVMEGGDSNV